MAASWSAAGSPLMGHRPLEAPEPSRNLCSSVTFLPKQQRWDCSLFTWVACCATPRDPGCPPPPRRVGASVQSRRARGASGGGAQCRVLPDGKLVGSLLRRILSAVCALQGAPCLCRRNRRPSRRSCRSTWNRSPGSRRTRSGATARRKEEDGWRWAMHRGRARPWGGAGLGPSTLSLGRCPMFGGAASRDEAIVRGSLELTSVLDTGLVSFVRGPALRLPCRVELLWEGRWKHPSCCRHSLSTDTACQVRATWPDLT